MIINIIKTINEIKTIFNLVPRYRNYDTHVIKKYYSMNHTDFILID